MASAFVGGPKPGVGYDKLVAEVPKIRAILDAIDESVFKLTPLVFMTLVDRKEDSRHPALPL